MKRDMWEDETSRDRNGLGLIGFRGIVCQARLLRSRHRATFESPMQALFEPVRKGDLASCFSVYNLNTTEAEDRLESQALRRFGLGGFTSRDV